MFAFVSLTLQTDDHQRRVDGAQAVQQRVVIGGTVYVRPEVANDDRQRVFEWGIAEARALNSQGTYKVEGWSARLQELYSQQPQQQAQQQEPAA